MAREPVDYWEKRQTELMKRLEKGTEKTIDELISSYEKATKDIQNEITKIFNKYKQDGKLTREEAIKLLNTKETRQFYDDLLEQINTIKDTDIKRKLLAKYNAPAYGYRISRYEALQKRIDIEIKKVAEVEKELTTERYIDTINETYYRNIFDIQQNLGYAFSFSKIDNKTIDLLLNENWIDKANFSQRIWNNSEFLGNYLRTNLTASAMSGKSINKIAQELADYMNVGIYNAVRLVRTEVNHFANEAEMLAYEELEIEKYRFIATLDNRTCEHCAELDNKVFNVKDRQPGKNYPPIHANDRCTTVAVLDDEVTDGLERKARDENGKPILVPQDMNYKDWYDKYVESNDYIIKTQNNYKAVNEKLSIKQAIKTIPNKYKDLLKNVQFDIITQGNSGYKDNNIYILKGADKYEVIHEVGHLLEDKLKIYDDIKFKNIIENTLSNFSVKDIVFDPETFTKGIFRIESDKFVTEYQGRIYQNIGFQTNNGKLNYKAFREYFSEGLRIYYQDNKLLKRKNIDLYNYIKELME